MSSRKMRGLIANGFALAFAMAGYSGSALADGGEGGCGSGGSGSSACLWSEGFEKPSDPKLPTGWTVTDKFVVTSDVHHNGSQSLWIYDSDTKKDTHAIDASATFLGGVIGNFSDVKLSFYWKPYNSESPDQLQVQMLSGGNVVDSMNGISWVHDKSDGWNKATLDFGPLNLDPFGLKLNLAINGSKEGFYVDDFCLTGTLVTTPVPEPETYAMMLAGLGLMGFIARRRKQNAAA